MKLRDQFVVLSITALLLAQGCAGVTFGQDVLAGRNALQTGRPNDAIGYLARAAPQNPNYALDHAIDGAVLSLLGRAYYETGRDAEARATHE